MTKRFCDLCGEEIKTWANTKWKIKTYWSDMTGSGWTELEAHEACIQAVARAAKKKPKPGGEKE